MRNHYNRKAYGRCPVNTGQINRLQIGIMLTKSDDAGKSGKDFFSFNPAQEGKRD